MVANERALTPTGPRTIGDPREEEQLTRQLILKNATEPQLKLVMGICNRYGFDPLLKHVVIVSNNIYVTRDGLLHLAHASGQFNGIGVSMEQAKNGEWMATCTVHRKDMDHPIVYTAFESEHKPSNPGGSAWGKYPRAMLQKCAEVMALRRAFDVSVGAAEEIGYDAPSGQTEHGQARFVEATVREVPPVQIAAPVTPPAESRFVATVRQMGEDGITVKEISEFINSEWDNVTEAEQFASTEALDAIKATRRAARMAKLQPPAAPIEATVVETPPIEVGPLGDSLKPATERQVKFIFGIGKEAKLDQAAVDTLSRGLFGGAVNELNRRDATLLIEEVRRQRTEAYQRPQAEIDADNALEDVPFG